MKRTTNTVLTITAAVLALLFISGVPLLAGGSGTAVSHETDGTVPAAGEKPVSAAGAAPPSVVPAASFNKSFSAGLAAMEYNASEGRRGLQAPNRRHNLRTYFEAAGIRVVGRTGPGERELLTMQVTAFGREGFLLPVDEASVRHDGPRVEYLRPAFTEWYVNSPAGLEQGFTIPVKPEGTGELMLVVRIGAAALKVTDTGITVTAYTGRRLKFGKLTVTDARGKQCAARFVALQEDTVGIAAAAADAVYPLTIDPLLTGIFDSGIESDQDAAWLGWSVDGAGDINGDGFDDIIVGAPNYDVGFPNEGIALIFHGSASGISDSTPADADTVIEGGRNLANLGYSVSSAGDVNNDGFDDVIIGAIQWNDGGPTREGAAFVFHGGAGGIASTGAPSVDADGYIQGEQSTVYLGTSVSGAGDVNGDGFDDIIVGAPNYMDSDSFEGAAFVFRGSAGGIVGTSPLTAVAYLDGDKAGAFLGTSVSGAGDVNGDGYDDVIVGAPRYNNGAAEEGIAVVFLGNPGSYISGNNPLNAHAILESNQEGANFGNSVSDAGDVNSDGYGDVIVGSYNYNQGAGEENEGAAFVFHGSSSGIDGRTPSTAARMLQSNQFAATFGISVSGVGDVNSDGYDDVIIGADHFDNGESDEGAAFVFLGSGEGVRGINPAFASTTLQSNQVDAQLGYSVAGAGDINGDGFNDVIVGARYYDNGEEDEGMAFLCTGSPPQAGFGSADSSGSESETTVPLQVTLTWATLDTCTVDYEVTGGTATGGGVDYTLADGTLTFVAGETSASIGISIENDPYDEDDVETIVITLSNPNNCSLGIGVHTYSILDDDLPPLVAFDTATSGASEAVTGATASVSLGLQSGKLITVEYYLGGGSATAGVDFTLVPGILTFNPGETTKTIPFTVVNDELYEDDEEVVVGLNNPVNATLDSPFTHIYTIQNNDAQPNISLALSTSSGSEGVTPASIEVVLETAVGPNIGSGIAASIDYEVLGGTADGSGVDYTLLGGGTINYAPGETTHTISMAIIDDNIYEGNEVVQLILSDPDEATLISPTMHTFTITENDPIPSIAFAAATSSGDESVSPVSLEVTLSGRTSLQVTVDYVVDVDAGTATVNEDYDAVAGTLTFAPLELSKNIEVTVINDTLDELDETVVVELLNPPPGFPLGTHGTTNHTYTIIDNEAAPPVSFVFASSSGDESVSPTLLDVVLESPSALPISINYRVNTVDGGTAAGGGVDYTLLSGTLDFAPGMTAEAIGISVENDALDELDETVNVELLTPVNCQLGLFLDHQYTILDDDPPPDVAFELASSNGIETVPTVTLTVQLSAVSTLEATVDYAATGGTATGGGTDYTLASGTLTFSAGETVETFDLTINDDAIFEDPDETVVMTLSGAVNCTITGGTHTYTIDDDELQIQVIAGANGSVDAGAHGIITGTEYVDITYGNDITFLIFPDKYQRRDGLESETYYRVQDVVVDDDSKIAELVPGRDPAVGETVEYSFLNVQDNHTIEVLFHDTDPPIFLFMETVDIDQNGFWDTITFTFSEPLKEAGEADLTDWVVYDADGPTNLLTGLSNGDVTIAGDQVTIDLDNATGTDGKPYYAYFEDGLDGALQDNSGNLVADFVTPDNTAPVAVGEPDQTTDPTLVFLDASLSYDPDGHPIYFLFAQLSGPVTAELYDAETSLAYFVAKASGTYVFRLRVTDPFRAVDEMEITVRVRNSPPTAHAGFDRSVNRDGTVSAEMTLYGTGSTDANDFIGYSDIDIYDWTQVSGPAAVDLKFPHSSEAAFDTSVLPSGVYRFQLEVTDHEGEKDTDEVQITVNVPDGNITPLADAGIDIVQSTGREIRLDGHESRDSNGDSLTYLWEQVSGPVAALQDGTERFAGFLPPEAGTYTFGLTVNDGTCDSAMDTVDVFVFDPLEEFPVASIMASSVGRVNETVSLTGEVLGVADPSGISVEWTRLRGTYATLQGQGTLVLSFYPVLEGTYRFRLDVSKGSLQGRGAEATITVSGESSPPWADAGEEEYVMDLGETLTLDGTGSGDADDDPLRYEWSQVLGPNIPLSDSKSVTPLFTPALTGLYRFDLRTFDSRFYSRADTVYITVHDLANRVPTAVPLEDEIIKEIGAKVTINAELSYDADPEDVLLYQWIQVAGPLVALDDPYNATPAFVPPSVGTYIFELYVDDGDDRSLGATVTVIIVEPGQGPGPTPGGQGGGGCFVATAAFGSPLAEEVDELRWFRNRYLLPATPGRLLVDLYCRLSPPLARRVRGQRECRRIARLLLAPVIRGINVMRMFDEGGCADDPGR